MKKNGFIATSLIYSFFLAFVALIMLLLTSFLSNKTTLSRYNNDILDRINNTKRSLTIFLENGTIDDALVYTNLLSNANFSDNLEYWNINNENDPTCKYTIENKTISPTCLDTYLSQNIYLEKNNEYYITMEYSNTNGDTKPSPSFEYLEDPKIFNSSNFEKKDLDTSFEKKINTIYKYTGPSQNYDFILDKNIYNMKLFNIMIINLTETFGTDIPSLEWLNKNIVWTNDNMNIYQIKDIKKNDKIIIRTENITEENKKNNIYVNIDSNKTNQTFNIKCDSFEQDIASTDFTNKYILDSVSGQLVCRIK